MFCKKCKQKTENVLDLSWIPGRQIGRAGQNCWGSGSLAKPPGWPRGRRAPDSGRPTLAQNCEAGCNTGCAPLPPGLWTAAGPSIQSGPGVYCQIYWEHWGGREGKCVVRKTMKTYDSSKYNMDKCLYFGLFCCWCHAKGKRNSKSDCCLTVTSQDQGRKKTPPKKKTVQTLATSRFTHQTRTKRWLSLKISDLSLLVLPYYLTLNAASGGAPS